MSIPSFPPFVMVQLGERKMVTHAARCEIVRTLATMVTAFNASSSKEDYQRSVPLLIIPILHFSAVLNCKCLKFHNVLLIFYKP